MEPIQIIYPTSSHKYGGSFWARKLKTKTNHIIRFESHGITETFEDPQDAETFRHQMAIELGLVSNIIYEYPDYCTIDVGHGFEPNSIRKTSISSTNTLTMSNFMMATHMYLVMIMK
jgi:hypothetical protein